jgi:hypothetical protein
LFGLAWITATMSNQEKLYQLFNAGIISQDEYEKLVRASIDGAVLKIFQSNPAGGECLFRIQAVQEIVKFGKKIK